MRDEEGTAKPEASTVTGAEFKKTMNKTYLNVIWATILFVIIAFSFPPWNGGTEIASGNGSLSGSVTTSINGVTMPAISSVSQGYIVRETPLSYGFIGLPPAGASRIDSFRLLLECAGIALVAGGTILTARITQPKKS